jgi:hypothetical protein
MAELPEDVRLAVFGYNPSTGKAYTEAEARAVSGGYLPSNFVDIVDYSFDPKSGDVTVTNKAGMSSTLGARFKESEAGKIVPDIERMNEAGATYGEDVAYDEFGVPMQYSTSKTAASKGRKEEILRFPGGQGKGTSATGGAGGAGGFAGAGVNTGAGRGATPLPGTPEFAAFQARESAYNLLYQQMAAYGLQSLVEPLKNLVTEGISPSEFTIRLRDTAAYKQRFAANQSRINKGLRALSEAEYIGLEDQYQDVMRRYGMPETYYKRGDLGRQEGFEKFISGDVSPVELEDRIQTAYNRVVNANPEVGIALRNFYPSITNGDILAYSLDPDKALDDIKRKITAAEIGGAAVQAGLTTNESDAQYLARYGITKEQAQQGYRTISGYLPRAQQLSSIYGKQVEGGPYTQASAEREVFNVPGAAEEERKRLKISQLEQAAFSGSSGLTGGALGRERAGQF